MGRKAKKPEEIVKTAGISLTDAEQDRAVALAAHLGVSKSAAGRTAYLLGLAVFDALLNIGIEIPVLPITQASTPHRNTAPSKPAHPTQSQTHTERPDAQQTDTRPSQSAPPPSDASVPRPDDEYRKTLDKSVLVGSLSPLSIPQKKEGRRK